MTDRTPSVLVIHDTPGDFRATLDAHFPGVPIRYAATAAQVLEGLAEGRPDAVFSIKHAGFPGPAHRPAVDFPSVRWVHIGGSGYEHFVPWDAARVTLTNSLGLLARIHAESVMGAILAFNRGLLDYRDLQRRRAWAPTTFPPLEGRTILVVGLGAIGAEVARLARAFGLRVVGVRRGGAPHPDADEVHGPAALPRLLGLADIVSVHVRLSPETTGLLGRDAFAAMKPGAMLVNTSRGAVVDEPALVEALRSGRVGRAYLDVFAVEPLPADSPLWGFDNVMVTPHACENVADWGARCAGLFAANLDRWIKGGPLQNVVRP